MNIRIRIWFVCTCILAFYLFLHFAVRDHPLMMDERFHFGQIVRFANGDFRLSQELSMGPGYHAVLAFPVALFHITTFPAMRTLAFLLHVLTIPVFYITAKKIHAEDALIKTVQFSFLSLFTIYAILLYSDVFSTMLILLSFFFVLRKKYSTAGILGLASLVVRQTNIIWVGLFLLIIWYQEYGLRFSVRRVLRFLQQGSVFLLSVALFVLFVYVNKGVALGGKDLQPVTYSLGNVYFFFFLYFFTFLSECISAIPRIVKQIKRYPLLIVVVVLLYVLFLFSFTNTHPWNQTAYFLRNAILHMFTSSQSNKTLFFIPVLISFLSFFVMKLYRKDFYFLYPVSLFFLLWVWLIEPRYYLTTFALLLLMKRQSSKSAGYLNVIPNILLSLFVVVEGLVRGKFFP